MDEDAWTKLVPPLRSKSSREDFRRYAAQLRRLGRVSDDRDDAISDARRGFMKMVLSLARGDKQLLLAAGLVISDLVMQGWELVMRKGAVHVRPPREVSDDRGGEKARIRRQELLKRDAQLGQAAVQRFLKSMERPRLVDGKFTSIFSLMRDGRELAARLREARAHMNNGWAGVLKSIVDPYLEFVSSDEAACAFTGLRLMDVWRYFRHTWSNQYTSVPGRGMMFLVRDRAAPCHPVIGIGALASPVMQIRERDVWIGWHPETFLARLKANPTVALARWLVKVLDTAIDEIYVGDLLEDGVLSARELASPTEKTIANLLEESSGQRRLHHRFARSRDHKAARSASANHWVERSEMQLFRSKRALALASYLRAKSVINKHFGGRPTAAKLAKLAATAEGCDAVRRLIKKAKGDRVGISVADISVCGAIQPYNAILGGKLVAMLAASAEVVVEYHRRYARAESEIASAMAGRSIVREPHLVVLGTTSLYGIGSSQYNRIKVPCDRVGGSPQETIRYAELGHSEAFGTSQYSEETVDALADLAQQSANGQRVNSIFGEGTSPKLRKVRHGLDLLDFPSGPLLRHHRHRVVYGVSLVRNLHDYLVGLDAEPVYTMNMTDPASITRQLAEWWRERWLRNRILSDEVLDEVARHTLVRPIRHGARVVVPPPVEQQLLFADQL